MSTRAKCIFKFVIQGNGRNETIVRQPVCANSDYTIVTEGSVSLQSPAMMSQVTLQPGWNQIIDPAAYLTVPTARNYFALVPPTGSTIPKVIAGATTDQGVAMTPNLPLALALPPGAVQIYVFNGGATAEICDQWTW